MRAGWLVVAVCAVAGCDAGDAPIASRADLLEVGSASPSAPVPSAPPAPRRDASIAAPAGEHHAPCQPDEQRSHRFAFGSLSAPEHWCWRRTEEGDDLSGVLLDAAGRVRAHYTALAFGAKVGDACDAQRPGVHGARSGRADGIAYRTCDLDDGRRCYSFYGAANVCLEPRAAGDADTVKLLP